ncbi:MAG: phospho-sugar mutase [Oscillospiraceae bacterium]|nr:phospho-sugar mutase [Oscillospiraceae bacterium]
MWKTNYENWLAADALTAEEQAELLAIAGDEAEIAERFHAPLSFGTAGLRGIMGVGSYRMNVHVIRHAAQGFASVILAEGRGAAGVVISYDSRINSERFAREAAQVMAANGVRVRLFDGMRPTPELSFAIRHYGAAAGINVTASHNPKIYNGFKVYWSDGAQLPPRFAAIVASQMEETDIFSGVKTMDYKTAVEQGLITLLGAETDEAFLACVLEQSVDRACVEAVADDFKVVYTPLHGTGRDFVPEALSRLGVRHILPVEAQMAPDGAFPTVKSPNPEDPAAFDLGLEIARAHGADIIIATDPDADRVGAMVRHGGGYQMLSGNQMGVLLLGYLIEAKGRGGTLPENAAFIKSMVTTEMAADLARSRGITAYETLTGFKFIAEKIAALGTSKTVIFSFEESYGYMAGDFVRDKDAVTASLLIAEMTAWYKTRGMTLLDGLEEHFRALGAHYGEETLNVAMPGLDGLKKMRALMESLRQSPPAEIGGRPVVTTLDYQSGKQKTAGVETDMELKGSDTLSFTLDEGTTLIIRPSGTEPKVKIYILARGADQAACAEVIRRCKAYADGLGQ